MVERAVVVGAGGHCRVVLSILKFYEYDIIGIADRDNSSFREEISGVEVNCTWKDLAELYEDGAEAAFIAIGDNKERRVLFEKLKTIGYKLPYIVHPSAIIEKDAEVNDGAVICMGAKIGTQVHIGENCIIYTGSIIDHESVIAKDVFIAPGVNIAGRVKISQGSFIGIGSSIKEKISIGQNAIIGAGSVVIKDISDYELVAGVPAKSIKEKK